MSNIQIEELKSVRDWEEALLLSRSYVDSALVVSLTKQFQSDVATRLSGVERKMETVRKCHLLLGWNFSCHEITRPKVADIGGGNGYMFDWIKSAHPLISPDWVVFESKEIAEAYEKFSADIGISFAASTLFNDSCEFDLTIISCAIQYLYNWEDVLETAFKTSKYVLLMRTPLIDSDEHQVFVQTPGSGLYLDSNASWPLRMFSRKKLMRKLERLSETIFSTYDPEETFPFNGSIFPLETYLLKSKLKN
jgi:putative methyltransferase (TIGR04325 family)